MYFAVASRGQHSALSYSSGQYVALLVRSWLKVSCIYSCVTFVLNSQVCCKGNITTLINTAFWGVSCHFQLKIKRRESGIMLHAVDIMRSIESAFFNALWILNAVTCLSHLEIRKCSGRKRSFAWEGNNVIRNIILLVLTISMVRHHEQRRSLKAWIYPIVTTHCGAETNSKSVVNVYTSQSNPADVQFRANQWTLTLTK